MAIGLVGGDQDCTSVAVFTNKGDATLSGPSLFSVQGGVQSLVIRDITGDSKPDLLVASSQAVTIFVNSH